MADDESRNIEPEIVPPAPGVPPSREPRHDPGVIEGEATEIHESAPPEPAAEGAAEEPAAAPAPEARAPEAPVVPTRPRAGLFLGTALGALVGAALALGVAYFLDPRAAALDAATARMAGQTEAAAALDKRVRALEADEAGLAKAAALDALGRRVATLEGAAGKGDAGQAALAEARAARADAAKALALAEQSPPAAGAAPATLDLGPLNDRLGKLEAALAAPKSEARVAASQAAPDGGGGAAAAILAISLAERLDAGAPFAQELSALTRLGADGAKLAALKPYADAGAPTVAALAAAFAKVEPAIAAAAEPPSAGGVVDRLLDHMRKLVRVHKVGEAAGADADALVPRIASALGRGDLASALDAYGRLPEAARQAGGDWSKAAQARQAAEAAALSLRADAIGRLAAARN